MARQAGRIVPVPARTSQPIVPRVLSAPTRRLAVRPAARLILPPSIGTPLTPILRPAIRARAAQRPLGRAILPVPTTSRLGPIPLVGIRPRGARQAPRQFQPFLPFGRGVGTPGLPVLLVTPRRLPGQRQPIRQPVLPKPNRFSLLAQTSRSRAIKGAPGLRLVWQPHVFPAIGVTGPPLTGGTYGSILIATTDTGFGPAWGSNAIPSTSTIPGACGGSVLITTTDTGFGATDPGRTTST